MAHRKPIGEEIDEALVRLTDLDKLVLTVIKEDEYRTFQDRPEIQAGGLQASREERRLRERHNPS